MRALTGLFIAIALAASKDSAEEVVVTIVESKNAKPIPGVMVRVQWGSYGRDPKGYSAPLKETDRQGRAVFEIHPPLLNYIVVYPQQNLFACARAEFPTEDVLRSGVVGENHCKAKNSKNEKFTAGPGEIVVFVRRETLRDVLASGLTP